MLNIIYYQGVICDHVGEKFYKIFKIDRFRAIFVRRWLLFLCFDFLFSNLKGNIGGKL